MPTTPLETRLNGCNVKLDGLFQGVKLNEAIEKQLNEIKEYYRNLYLNAAGDNEEECIQIYEFFVQGLEEIKIGQCKSDDVLKQIDEINFLRKIGIILENIVNVLELLFWASSACAFLTASVAFSAPLVAANPFLALAALATACIGAIYSIGNFFECVDGFKSLTPVKEEYKREKDLISFFKSRISPKTLAKDEPEHAQEVDGLILT